MQMMLDFQIKTWDERMGGLNMGLCPGKYIGRQSRNEAIFIPEGAFGCIEPTIKECSAHFSRKYSHWGITEIPRDEWTEVIQMLGVLQAEAARASSPEELLKALPLPETMELEFKLHFEVNRNGLCNLLDQLLAWLQKTLREDNSISVLGL
jgi:hypothetical protein